VKGDFRKLGKEVKFAYFKLLVYHPDKKWQENILDRRMV
jgi:hypothetical protein